MRQDEALAGGAGSRSRTVPNAGRRLSAAREVDARGIRGRRDEIGKELLHGCSEKAPPEPETPGTCGRLVDDPANLPAAGSRLAGGQDVAGRETAVDVALAQRDREHL